MSRISETKTFLIAGGWVLAGLLLASQQRSLAEDSSTAEGAAKKCQIRVEVRGSIPGLSEIPGIVRLFQAGDTSVCCDALTCHSASGSSDCDVIPGHFVTVLANGERQVSGPEHACVSCDAPSGGCLAKIATITKSSCSARACTGDSCEGIAVTQHVKSNCPCAAKDHLVHVLHGREELGEVGNLRVELAALKAECHAQERILEARREMFERAMKLSTENARLTQEIAHLHERGRLQDELLQLRAENEKLKSSVELAAQRGELLKQMAQAAVENERLKVRVAELEGRAARSNESTHTARKSRGAKKPTELK